MPNVEINGTRLEYVEQGAGQPVVFVHGGAADLRVWANQMEPFAQKYRAIALSCRHYYPNEEIKEGEALHLSTIVEDLAAFLRNLDLAPAHLIGHSSPGAFSSLLLASKEPELIRALVLAEPPALPLLGLSLPPKPQEILKLMLRDPRTGMAVIKFGARGIGPASRAFERGDDERGLQLFLKAALGQEGYARLSEATLQNMRDNLGGLKGQLRAGFPPFDERDARSISVPTLLVTGEQSATVLHRITDRLENLIPTVERVEIKDASHGMFQEKPQAFNRAVLAFLEKHDD